MSFNLQQLEMFCAIVGAGSLGRAAHVLGLTQPALSRAIKRLEESVGGILFERHTTGMHLTQLGQALLPHALSLQREAKQARDELDALRGLSKGVIKVGAVGSIASLVLPLAVAGVLEKWPNLRVEIIEGVWDRLAEGLLTHEIDLALGTSGMETDGVAAIADCCWTDLSYVVAGNDHPLAFWQSSRQRPSNASYFAFTATPKHSTLMLFGRAKLAGQPVSKENPPVPFHLYTMQQAIDEGFILDVLKNYTSYKVAGLAFRIEHGAGHPPHESAACYQALEYRDGT